MPTALEKREIFSFLIINIFTTENDRYRRCLMIVYFHFCFMCVGDIAEPYTVLLGSICRMCYIPTTLLIISIAKIHT